MTRHNATQERNRSETRKRRALPTTFVASLADALDSDIYRTFVCSEPPSLAELAGLELAGWRVYADGHYPTLRADSPARVIQFAPQWFGPVGATVSPDRAAVWWRELDARLRSAFDGHGLLSTPATTGRALLAATLDRDAFPVMANAWQDRVRSMSGQGRIQVMPDPNRPRLKRGRPVKFTVTEYDQRLSYSAVLRRMPVGDPVELDPGEASAWWSGSWADGFPIGKVFATWQAPEWGDRPGILPAFGEHGATVYPVTGSGWVDAVELDLAQRHRWRVDVGGAIVWDTSGDPFRLWRDRLGRLIEHGDGVMGSWWLSSLRAIMLHTIGALHGAPRRHTVMGDEPPAGAERLRRAGDRWAWTITAPAAWPEMSHPEWSSTVWARARRRLLDAPGPNGCRVGALHVEPGSVVALRTDAVYIAGAHEPWPDDGAAGRYRFRGAFMMDTWPTGSAQLLAAKRATR